MSDSPLIEAARRLRERQQNVSTAITQADPDPQVRPAGKPSVAPGVTLEQALRTEGVGEEGEVTFGAPLVTVPVVNGETPAPFIDPRVVRPDPLKPRKEEKDKK